MAPHTPDRRTLPFPTFPRAVYMGRERVYGVAGGRIVWDAFVSMEPIGRVEALYRDAVTRQLGAEAALCDPPPAGGGIWRFARPDLAGTILDVRGAASPGPFERYRHRIPDSARTVVILARRM